MGMGAGLRVRCGVSSAPDLKYSLFAAGPRPPSRQSAFALACAFARSGQGDSAFAALDRLNQTGYSQPEQLMADSDLASVREDPRFLAVVARAKHAASPCMDAAEFLYDRRRLGSLSQIA